MTPPLLQTCQCRSLHTHRTPATPNASSSVRRVIWPLSHALMPVPSLLGGVDCFVCFLVEWFCCRLMSLKTAPALIFLTVLVLQVKKQRR